MRAELSYSCLPKMQLHAVVLCYFSPNSILTRLGSHFCFQFDSARYSTASAAATNAYSDFVARCLRHRCRKPHSLAVPSSHFSFRSLFSLVPSPSAVFVSLACTKTIIRPHIVKHSRCIAEQCVCFQRLFISRFKLKCILPYLHKLPGSSRKWAFQRILCHRE